MTQKYWNIDTEIARFTTTYRSANYSIINVLLSLRFGSGQIVFLDTHWLGFLDGFYWLSMHTYFLRCIIESTYYYYYYIIYLSTRRVPFTYREIRDHGYHCRRWYILLLRMRFIGFDNIFSLHFPAVSRLLPLLLY